MSEPGTLFGETEAELMGHVGDLVPRMLSAVRARVSATVPKITRLTKELSHTFSREKLLGRGEEAINQHKIVRNVSVSSDVKLRADFAARNRVMHITETVDLRTDGKVSTARMKDIAVAAMTLDEAKRTFGRSTQRYFIYAGGAAAERQARGFLQAAQHHADHVFNYSSRDDRASYLDFMFSALRGDLAARGAGENSRKKAARRAARRS